MDQPTRRAALAATPALSLLFVSGSTAAPPAARHKASWPEMVATLEFLHPNGRAVAIHAMAAGMLVEHVSMISLCGFDSRMTADETQWPCVMFTPPGDRTRTFRPWGEIHG